MLLAVLALSLNFSACSSDDDEPAIPEDEISESDFVGYWKEDPAEGETLYLILEDDGTGMEVVEDKYDVYSSSFTWRFRRGYLIVTDEEYNERIELEVVSISKTTMRYINDEGDEFTYKRVKKSDIPEVEYEPDVPEIEVAGKWRGTVYENGESLNEWVTVELGNNMSYKDYNAQGKLIGSGYFTYSGNTIKIPDGYISNDWGNTYTVTVSGKNMKWTNSTMKNWDCEYRFTKQ